MKQPKKKIDIQKSPAKPISEISKNSKDGLIFFDIKVKVFLFIVIGGYIVISLLKIHSCSTPVWNSLLGVQNSKDLLWGQPRGIRQDDWLVVVPGLISQVKSGFPKENYSLGGYESGYASSHLPTDIFRDIFRPKLWGYYLFDLETGFAFDWNSKVTILLVGAFLFFMILTYNNFWLSVFGALWLFLSSTQVWWSNNIGAMVGYSLFVFVSFLYLLTSKSLKHILISGICLVFALYDFAVQLYPAHQVPIAYFLLALLAGYIHQNGIDKAKALLPAKVIVSIASLAFVVFLMVYGYLQSTNAINAVMNTVYPGKRLVLGGDLDFPKLFSDFFCLYITDVKVPEKWLNICEASNCIMFFPIVIAGIAKSYISKKKVNIILVYLVGMMLFSLSWMFIGMPEFLSKITLFSMVPAYRLLPIFGLFNVVLTVLFINECVIDKLKKYSLIEIVAVVVCTCVSIALICFYINTEVSGFFKKSEVIITIVLISMLYLSCYFSANKIFCIAFCVIVLAMVASNFKVNPIVKGLKPLLSNPIVNQVKDITNIDKDAKWVVFGSFFVADLLKVSSVPLFNGTKFPPDIKEMKVLDPSPKADSVYNRYAHINVQPFVTPNDSVVFMLNENKVVNDNYTLFIDPCSRKLNSLNVKYFIFTYQPQPAEIRCMTLISSGSVLIYKSN